MRIAVVGKKYPFCGIVTYCRELVRAMRAAGHTVAFYYLANEADEACGACLEDGLPYAFKTHIYALPALNTRERLERRLRDFRPDVVHASYALSPLDWQLPDVCARLGVPLVATFHVALDHRPTLPNRVSSFVYRLYAPTLARCERVVVFSQLQRERLIRYGVAAQRIAIVPNGVDTQRYCPGPSRFRAELGAQQLVGFMGRLDPEKNVGTLVEAFLRQPLPTGTHLVIVGEGILGARLRLRFAGVANVHWLGFVADEQRRIDILRGLDAFVLPSSVEGLSLALLEAMACGAVPLATDVGADGEVVQGVGRVLDPTRLQTQLGPAIAATLADPAALATARMAARQRTETVYGFEHNLCNLLEVYTAAGAGLGRLRRQR